MLKPELALLSVVLGDADLEVELYELDERDVEEGAEYDEDGALYVGAGALYDGALYDGAVYDRLLEKLLERELLKPERASTCDVISNAAAASAAIKECRFIGHHVVKYLQYTFYCLFGQAYPRE